MLKSILSARTKGLMALAALLLFVVPTAAQAAKWYVDNTLGEVKPEERRRPRRRGRSN